MDASTQETREPAQVLELMTVSLMRNGLVVGTMTMLLLPFKSSIMSRPLCRRIRTDSIGRVMDRISIASMPGKSCAAIGKLGSSSRSL
jgi:hypothetical protein